MKTSLWIVILVALTSLWACSSPLEHYGRVGGRGQGFRVCPYECSAPKNFTCRSGTITGKITKISIEQFAEDMEPGIAFTILTGDGNQAHVHVGPLWFMEKRESDFQEGDTVTIEGLCYHKNDRQYLIAVKMTHKDHTLNLRDSQGRPYWGDNPAI
ncbi:MAG: hypothetical protein PHU44_12360 [Syntrophales bacterium]|nr:hypothetical protein [Syntrophales bacterium]MDD5641309.1 hypothetical protein [Syntrophales bacterium]